ncbi:MAG: T9SS type A sorting domain-containing protein [Bacteroidota bacterium]
MCGNAHSQCFQLDFTVDVFPDSIRVFGAEGAGNPVGGCYPNPDMLIDLSGLPVRWGDISATQRDFFVEVAWQTRSEVNNDYFQVERSADNQAFEAVGEVEAVGQSTSPQDYTFVDRRPKPGSNQYRIRQIDQNGNSEISKVVTVNYVPPSRLDLAGIVPHPVSDQALIRYLSDRVQSVNFQLYNWKGDLVMQEAWESMPGDNEKTLSLEWMPAGVYLLRLAAGGTVVRDKLVKL